MKLSKKNLRERRHKRVRTKIFGTSKRPRLCIFRSNKHIYAQLVDDSSGKVITAVSDKKISNKIKGLKRAREVGSLAAEKFVKAGYKNVIFDRGGYKYHGRVKALADGARSGGLNF